jgi:hypothetical protein
LLFIHDQNTQLKQLQSQSPVGDDWTPPAQKSWVNI